MICTDTLNFVAEELTCEIIWFTGNDLMVD